jgi:hypothetical protein
MAMEFAKLNALKMRVEMMAVAEAVEAAPMTKYVSRVRASSPAHRPVKMMVIVLERTKRGRVFAPVCRAGLAFHVSKRFAIALAPEVSHVWHRRPVPRIRLSQVETDTLVCSQTKG